jgi:hypothetical protein
MLYSQQTTACCYPDPEKSSLHPPTLFKIHYDIINVRIGLSSILSPSGFPTKILYVFFLFYVRATTLAISFSFILSP